MQWTKVWYGAGAIGVAATAAASPLLIRQLGAYWPVAQTAPAAVVREAATSSGGSPASRVGSAAEAKPEASTSISAAPSAPDPGRPGFDVVRVDKAGEAVVAGHAFPKATVQLRDEGRVIAQVDADESGQFVVLPPTLAAGSHRLELAALGGATPVVSEPVTIDVAEQNSDASRDARPSPRLASAAIPPPQAIAPAARPPAAVRVAPVSSVVAATAQKPAPSTQPAQGAPVAALSPAPNSAPPTPNGAETQGVPPAPIAPAAVFSGLAVQTVEAPRTGSLEVKGVAEPNSRLRLYLNGSHLADVSAGADKRWSLTIEHGMSPGFYTFRAEVVGRANGAAATRTDVPFSYPKDLSAAGTLLASSTPVAPAAAATASKPAMSSAAFAAAAPIAAFAPPKAPPGVAPALALPVASASIASPPADAVVSDVETATVVQGDNLWDLARRFYGDGTRFRRIYEANAAQIRVPSLIYIGQQLVVPKQPPP